MTVYPTNPPPIGAIDHYRYNGAGVLSEPLFPSSGIVFPFPYGTVPNDTIICGISAGTGATAPSVTVVSDDPAYQGIFYNTHGSSSSGSSFYWSSRSIDPEASETGLFIRFLSGGITPVTSPMLLWIIRLEHGTNLPPNTDGPRYQYWNHFDAGFTDRGRETPSGGGDFTFDPVHIVPGDSSLASGVPDGVAEVNGRWFQAMVQNTLFLNQLDDPNNEDYFYDKLPVPAATDGWELLADDVYITGSLVDTAALYTKIAEAAEVTFPPTTLTVDDYIGEGAVVTFLDYDYDVAPDDTPPPPEEPEDEASQYPPNNRRSGNWEEGGLFQRAAAIQQRSGIRDRVGMAGVVRSVIGQNEQDVARVRRSGDHTAKQNTTQRPGPSRRERVGEQSKGKYPSGEFVLSTASLTGDDPLRVHDKGDPDIFAIRATPDGDLEVAGNLTLTEGGFIRSGATGFRAEMSAGEFPFRLYQAGSIPAKSSNEDEDDSQITGAGTTLTSTFTAPPTVGHVLIAAAVYRFSSGSPPNIAAPDTGWSYSSFDEEVGVMIRLAYKVCDDATADQTITWENFPWDGTAYPAVTLAYEVDFGVTTPALDRLVATTQVFTSEEATIADPEGFTNFTTGFQLAIVAAAGQIADEYQRFQGGTDGNTVATGAPSFDRLNGYPFDTENNAGGTFVYDDDGPTALLGSMAAKLTRNATTGALDRGYTLPAGTKQVATREYVYFPTLPTVAGGVASPDAYSTFDGGTDGNNIVAGETHSGTPFDAVVKGAGNTITYDSTRAMHGALAMKYTTSGTTNAYVQWNFPGHTLGYARVYQNIDAWPTGTFTRPIFFTKSGAVVAAVHVKLDGKFAIVDATGAQLAASTITAPIDADYRLECRVFCDPTVGSIELRIYTTDPESTGSPDETLFVNNCNTNDLFDQLRIGHMGQTGIVTAWIDSPAFDTTDWLGPFAAPSAGEVIFSGVAARNVQWILDEEGHFGLKGPMSTDVDESYVVQPDTLYRVEMRVLGDDDAVQALLYLGQGASIISQCTVLHTIGVGADISDVRFGITGHAENGWFYYLDDVAYNRETTLFPAPARVGPTQDPMSTPTAGWTSIYAANIDRSLPISGNSTELRVGAFYRIDEVGVPMSLAVKAGPSERVIAAMISFGSGDTRFQVDADGNIEAERLLVRSRASDAGALHARAMISPALALEARNPANLRTLAVDSEGALRFYARTGDAAAVAGAAELYSKTEDGITRLFKRPSSGPLTRLGFAEMEAGPEQFATFNNTNVETTLVDAAVDMPAGMAGSLNDVSPLWRAFVSGWISWQATSGTLTFRLRMGGTQLANVQIASQGTGGGPQPFWLEAYVFSEYFTGFTYFTSGSIFLRQSMSSAVAAQTGQQFISGSPPTIAVTAQWATASVSNQLQSTMAFIERLR